MLKNENIYRRLAAFFLLAVFLAQTFSRHIIIAGYYLNKAGYAKNCVNKAQPRLQCQGKCQIVKRLQQEDRKETEQPDRKTKNNIDGPLFSSASFASIPVFTGNTVPHKQILQWEAGTCLNRSSAIFHPPKFC